MHRLASSIIVLSLLAAHVPAYAEGVDTPASLPCEGTEGKARARCITDALKAWKGLEHEYDEAEDDEIAAWKAEHSTMGIGADYQKALRDFLNEVRTRRKEFDKRLNDFRKAFFDEQKSKRAQGDGRKATEKKLDKATLEAAKAKCGPEDDDGIYRTCMRQLLRGVPASVAKRSRSSNALLGK